MKPLDSKLGRDLWRVKGQALAIVLVIAFGVMMMVMMDGLVNSLGETKRTYYERYRLADLFAPVKRSPRHVLDEIVELPGISAVQGRINGAALISLPDQAVPVRAQAVSLPEFGSPRLNDFYLASGRPLNPSHRDEILLLEAFAHAHNLQPGDSLSATMNGARRRFHIVGLAQAPEFLYTTAPGELVPDDARFAVIWMNEEALAAAFDMDGAFNEALISLARDARPQAVIDSLDRLLAPYGATGAYGLEDHLSDRFISEEIAGLRVSSRTVPPIFLSVAAFLLYIVISRMVQAEREQIGLLKAFGYTSLEVGLHYFKFVLVIALTGALLGCALGMLAGRGLSGFYQLYYKFPFLLFRVDPAAFVTGFTVSVLTASAGGVLVLRRVFALTPADAMRPPTPPNFSQTISFGPGLRKWLDQPTRMVLRNMIRQPLRGLLAILGIALGMALSVAMLSLMSAFDRTLDLSFGVLDRSDVTVTFVEPLGDKTLFALKRMKGVIEVEPFRTVAAVMHNGRQHYRGAVTALTEKPRLFRALDSSLQAIPLPENGIVLSTALAGELDLKAGQKMILDVREGRRPTLEVSVAGLADTLMGAPAYMQLETLNRLMKEPNRVSGAYLRIDSSQGQQLYRRLKDMPVVAGVSLQQDSRRAFKKVMDTGAGAMRYVMALIAAVITFGIVYNSARIAFAERARDLASLRVIGLTRTETGFVLLGELGLITLLALPLGAALGYYFSLAVAAGFSTDLYRVPTEFSPASYGTAALAVLLAATLSGALVKRDINRLDLVSALKTRE
ncbi:ABC transporter permease [Bowmanella dokdonensis]|uniref:ABC transporter permease n=1 Tax=Bowmanella dokdonensis TaxID=751969 RepID=A0A939DPD4_9ALTE|nr:ABC transporter permease [Bowmanella dokdonensis]MBN7826223.1 ABC transporter permease [Bowmanella dokdonensis]